MIKTVGKVEVTQELSESSGEDSSLSDVGENNGSRYVFEMNDTSCDCSYFLLFISSDLRPIIGILINLSPLVCICHSTGLKLTMSC